MSTIDPIRSFAASADRLLSAGPIDGLPNVASLDAPHVKQTKTEIRKLSAEIAQLAHSDLSAGEFFQGFLSKLTLAMRATGAAVWDGYRDSSARSGQADTATPPTTLFQSRAHYQMPLELLGDSGEAPVEHARILQCVSREKQPILIPPQAVAVDAERPGNPTNEALVIVPVILEGEVECLVEVVQTACGGPAAQRGYLRFLAQMADLLADYLRRQLVKELTRRQELADKTEKWICEALKCNDAGLRSRIAANGLCETLHAQQAYWLQRSSWPLQRPKILAAAHLNELDPRSEVAEQITTLTALLDKNSQADEKSSRSIQFFYAADRRNSEARESALSASQSLEATDQQAIDAFCDLLHCRSLAVYDSPETPLNSWLLCFDAEQTAALANAGGDLASHLENPRAFKLLDASAALAVTPRSNSWLQPRVQSSGGQIRRVAAWAVAAVLLACVAFFPVPQQVQVQAILQPVNKYAYYAPMEAFVEKVYVSEGEVVDDQQPLLRLRSRKLDSQVESLLGDREQVNNQIDELENRLDRDKSISALERDRMEAQLGQLASSRNSLNQQLHVLSDSQKDLQVFALGAGQVSTWDLANRLQKRPVKAGQLLATTYDPSGPWRLQVAVPQHRIGLVMANMRQDSSATKVRFSLVSHPGQAQEATLERLASQIVSGETNAAVLYGEASLDASQLPIRKDGAVANATIDCGTVPVYWLVIRDAYWAIRTRFLLYR